MARAARGSVSSHRAIFRILPMRFLGATAEIELDRPSRLLGVSHAPPDDLLSTPSNAVNPFGYSPSALQLSVPHLYLSFSFFDRSIPTLTIHIGGLHQRTSRSDPCRRGVLSRTVSSVLVRRVTGSNTAVNTLDSKVDSRSRHTGSGGANGGCEVDSVDHGGHFWGGRKTAVCPDDAATAR